MKTKNFVVLVFVLYLLLNLSLVLAEEQNFKNVGNVLINGKEVPLSVRERGVEFTQNENIFQIKTQEGTNMKLGGKVIRIPSNAYVIIPKKTGNPISFRLSSDSEGNIDLDNGFNEVQVVFPNGDRIALKGVKQKTIEVKDGNIKLEQGNKILYQYHSSHGALVMESVSKLTIGDNGLSGIFKVINGEGLSVGEVDGSNIIPVLSSTMSNVIGGNVIAFSYDYRKKKIVGTLTYKDFAYDYVIETKNAEVNINLNDINFLDGKGHVTKSFKRGDSNLYQKFDAENGKVLVQPFFDSGTDDKDEKARTDLIIRGEKGGILVDISGKISDLNLRNKEFDVFDYGDLNLLVNRNEETLALYNSYLLSGFRSIEAVKLSDKNINPGSIAPFSKLLKFFSLEQIMDFVENDVPADRVKSYLDAGVELPFPEVLELVQLEVNPLKIKEYKPLIENHFNLVLGLNVPIEVINKYQKILEKGMFNSDIKNGDIYARLYYYGITPEDLEKYISIFNGLDLDLEPESGFTNFVDIIRRITPQGIDSYIKAGVKKPSLMVEFIVNNVKSSEVSKYKSGDEYTYFPGVSSKDISDYGGFSAMNIAAFKAAGLSLENIHETPNDKLLDLLNTKKKELMIKLNLKEEGYSLPFLDLVYKNWKKDKAEKPIFLIIVNKNDLNGAYAGSLIERGYIPLFRGYHVLLREASTDNEVKKHMLEVSSRFGQSSDSVAFLGHANSKSILLGDGKGEAYTIDESDDDLFTVIKNTVKNSVILDGCNAGKGMSSISRTINDATGKEVYAPTCTTKSIKYDLSNTGKIIGIEYDGKLRLKTTRLFTKK